MYMHCKQHVDRHGSHKNTTTEVGSMLSTSWAEHDLGITLSPYRNYTRVLMCSLDARHGDGGGARAHFRFTTKVANHGVADPATPEPRKPTLFPRRWEGLSGSDNDRH